MRTTAVIIGILLIIFGISNFVIGGIGFTQKEKVAELNLPKIAHVEVVENKEKIIPFSPLLGSISTLVGVVLVVGALIKKKNS